MGIRQQQFSRYPSTPDAKQGPVSHASSDGGPESYALNPANERPKNTSSCNGHNCAGNYLIGKTHTQTEPSRLALAAKVRAAAACQLSKFVSWLQLKSSSCCFIVSSEKPAVKRNAGCYQSLTKCFCVRSPLRIRRGFECVIAVITELKCWDKDISHY